MEQLDLNQIRNFVRIVQAGSFTKAAEVLKQPKSRVSRRLSALERELGIQLIYRTTRQFQLTESGKIYFERCKGLIEGLENLTSEISDATSEVSGTLKITASDDMGVTRLPEILDEFTKLYPRVRFDVILTQAYVDLVKESVDVAVRVGKLKDSSLRVKKIGNIRSIFVATPGFIERYRQVENIEQLSEVPFLTLSQLKQIEAYRTDGKKMTVKPNSVFSCNNPSMLLQMALLGRGAAFIPEFLAIKDIRSGRLVHLHKNYGSEETPISLVSPEQKEVPLKVKKFIEFAHKKLRDTFSGLESF